jgi:hypothetical protein
LEPSKCKGMYCCCYHCRNKQNPRLRGSSSTKEWKSWKLWRIIERDGMRGARLGDIIYVERWNDPMDIIYDSRDIIYDPPWVRILTLMQMTQNLQRHLPGLDRIPGLERIREVISHPKSRANFPTVLSTTGTYRSATYIWYWQSSTHNYSP